MDPQSLDELMTSLKDDKMITISTDDGKQTSSVQRALLMSASPWFRNALSERFQEGQDRILRFPGARPEVVAAFIYWLFNHALPATENLVGVMKEVNHAEQALAVRLWMFGEEHLLPRLQNDAMRRLHNSVAFEYPTLETVKEAYEGSPLNSVLRDKMIREVVAGWRDSFAGHDGLGYISCELESLSGVAGFLTDFAVEISKYVEGIKGHGEDDSSVEAYFVAEEPDED